MFELLTEIPFVALFIKFMIASTVLLGAVWLMEKVKLINSPDLAELAWKAAIAGSFIALVPIADFMSSTVVIENQRTATFIDRLNAERPLSELAEPTLTDAGQEVTHAIQLPPAEEPFLRPVPTARSAKEALDAVVKQREQSRLAQKQQAQRAGSERAIVMQPNTNAADNAGSPIEFLPEGDSETIIEPSFWQSAATLRTTDLAALGWVGLALLAIGALLVSYRSAVKNLGSRKRVQAEDHANKVLRSICEQADIRHVPYLSRSGDLKSPVCLPRKEICLPDWAFDDMPEDEFKSLLAHELGHMVRKDPIMLMALQVLSRTFFFQPLFILARKRLTDIAELAADEWAAEQAADSRAVANALFICATKIHETRQIQWGLAMAGNKSILKRRVERLIGAETTPFKTTSTVAKSALAVGVIGLGLGLPSIEFAGAHPHDGPINFTYKLSKEEKRRLQADMERLGVELEGLGGHIAEELADLRDLEVVGPEIAVGLEDSISVVVTEAVEAAAEAAGAIAHERHVFHGFDDDESGNITWHDDDMRLSINWEGSFRISDDDTTIIAEDDYGFVRIKYREGSEKRLIKFEGEDGETKVSYYVDGDKKELDADGKKWLKRSISKMIEAGFGAKDRVARILKNKGVKGVLAEVKSFKNDMPKRVYLSHLVNEANLKDKEIGQVIDVVGTMESDFEQRLALSHLLDDEKVNDKMLPKVLAVAKKFDSDFEKRLLVTQYVSELKLTDKSTNAVIEIAESMDSDFEIRLMLTAALSEAKLSDKNVAKIFDLAVKKIDSDFEMRILLTTFAEQFDNSDKVVAKVLDAVETMDSDFEKRLLLSTLVHEAKMGEKNWLRAIKLADEIDSDHEKRLVLMQMRNEIPEKNKKVAAALDKALEDEDMRYFAGEDRHEYESELAEELREAAEERREAIREALEGLRDHEFIEREAMKAQREALRSIERELDRVKRDQSRAKGSVQRELARAARELERAKRELERAFNKETKVQPDEEAEKVI